VVPAVEAVPTMEAVPAVEAPTAEAMPTMETMSTATPRVSWDGTCEEYCDQDDNAPHPLPEFPSTRMPVIHGILLYSYSYPYCLGLLALACRQPPYHSLVMDSSTTSTRL